MHETPQTEAPGGRDSRPADPGQRRHPLHPRRLFDCPFFYDLLHKLVSGSKEQTLAEHLKRKRQPAPLRVLDLGCGPGTNASLFADRTRYEYLGIDINEAYVKKAARRHELSFQVGDITRLPSFPAQYDIVLINSVFHHLKEGQTDATIGVALDNLSPEGECLVMDMVYPTERRWSNVLSRLLIRLDRGSHCREAAQLRALLESSFDTVIEQTFHIKLIGTVLWEMRLYVCTR